MGHERLSRGSRPHATQLTLATVIPVRSSAMTVLYCSLVYVFIRIPGAAYRLPVLCNRHFGVHPVTNLPLLTASAGRSIMHKIVQYDASKSRRPAITSSALVSV